MRNVSWLLVGFLLTLPGAVFAGMPFPMGGEGSNGLSTTAANALYVQLAGGIMTGQLVNRLDPAGTALTDASVLVNPGTCASNEILLGTGVAGAYRLSTDCEGDMLVAGTLGVTGATTLTSTLDAKGAISNTGASNSGRVYVDDALGLTDNFYITTANAGGAFSELQSSNVALASGLNLRNNASALKAQFAYGNASNGAPYGGNAYVYTPSGTGFNRIIGDVHISAETGTLIQNKVAVQMDTFMRLVPATYAATDCDALAEVGRKVMHNDGANHISGCLCEQTGAGTYAFKAESATGVCP